MSIDSGGTRFTLLLTPRGRLELVLSGDAPELPPEVAARIREAFDRGTGHGLVQLGGGEVGQVLPPVFSYFREPGRRYLTALCTRPDVEDRRGEILPFPEDLAALALSPPMMSGAEYFTVEVLRALWQAIGEAVAEEVAGSTAGGFLRRLNPAWNVVGRVHFNLAENRANPEAPFAFLATYTHRLSAQGKAQHLPLGQALREYAGADDRGRLLSLLLPVKRAAEHCPWLARMVDGGEIFHPLRWSAEEACRFLGDVPELERAGVVVRMPATWKSGRPSRAKVTATVGAKTPSILGMDALLDFHAELTVDGEALTADEAREILGGTSGLFLIRGQWVEVDRDRLARTMDRFREAERLAAAGGITFAEAMRTLAGAGVAGEGPSDGADPDWANVAAGPWLAGILKGLRSPDALSALDPGPEFGGSLRPYQQEGLRWLHLLSRLGLGACLADDMGLGKTIQVLALLLVLRREPEQEHRPSLLVAPASLLANWAAEIGRFAPTLRALVAHPSALPAEELKALATERIAGVDLVITSYGSLLRLPWLGTTSWRLAILDEAQAIKNPDAKQTRAAKKLGAGARIALTGTPVENRVGDLWSIFDFINPGLLGSAREFAKYVRSLPERQGNPYGPLRNLVRPYILRRLKTDRNVIADLPEKTEVRAFCQLSRRQAVLYEEAVRELKNLLEDAEGMGRRGLVLAFLMRLKQICNHPSQWIGDGAWAEEDSGKWTRLREIAEVIAARQEKMLVFTQFREVTGPLATFLGGLFGRPGLVLHGGIDVKERRGLVERFEADEAVPFFVLSLKAGGSGLNLTAASHVVHFDRWWNPAVEDQATDRAFRIGQKKNVLVHKFVCRGTVEEKIDDLIGSKKQLSRDLLEGGAELKLTEMADDELLKLVALDLGTAMRE
jgi:non-specific serine/threonine protein kinase